MTKKHTFEKVKEIFDQHNMVLIEDNYINSQMKMRYECKLHKGTIQSINMSNLQSGKGCKLCGMEKRKKAIRKNISSVLDEIESIGFQVINPNCYENILSVLKFKCKDGHEFEMRYCDLLRGKKCKVCRGISPVTENVVREIVENRGYELVKFVDSQSDIIVKCPNNHNTNIRWDRFRNGQECIECTGNKNIKYSYEEVFHIFKKNNLTLTSKVYKNIDGKLNFICPNGHKGSMPLKSVLRGYGCNDCGYIKAIMTMYENGTAPVSTQQKYIHNVIGGEINFPINKFVLDIAFPKDKIYLEYDGGGHNLSVTLGQISNEEFNKKEMIRSKILREKGWKEIRLITLLDKLPNEKKIKEMFDYAKEYLDSERHYIKFYLDEGIVKTSQFEKAYDFGELRYIYKETLNNVI